MQIVIDIPERTYEQLKFLREQGFDGFETIIDKAVANGTPLPKGHGRLIDADDLYDNTEICHGDIDGYACVRWKDINDAPTIIEAESEDNKDGKV